MSFILNILKKPYPFYIPFLRSFKLLIAFSLVVPVFLILFKPLGLGNSTCQQINWALAGIAVPIFLTLAINFYGVAKLFPSFFNEQSWSVWKESVWSIWNFLTIVITTGYYWTIVPVCASSSIYWTEQLLRSLLIGLVPGITCIYFNYNYALKRKLKKAESLNEKLLEKVSYYEHGKLKLTGENNTEILCLSTDDLVLVQSYDNYSKILLDRNGKQSTQLIRSSLKQLQSQINYSFIVRCHRSFIINLAKVENISGNARDFKVKLQNHPEWIPVSRQAYKNIVTLLEDFTPTSKQSILLSAEKSDTL